MSLIPGRSLRRPRKVSSEFADPERAAAAAASLLTRIAEPPDSMQLSYEHEGSEDEEEERVAVQGELRDEQGQREA